ncbi:Zn-dependent exopeptidase M28 [Pelomyxa schiedti]|nr:Zn-dependent exopeptidase M28 [Pelomyxa schiedti]
MATTTATTSTSTSARPYRESRFATVSDHESYLAVMGESGAGKTSFMRCCIKGTPCPVQDPDQVEASGEFTPDTEGYVSTRYKDIALHIWDRAGDEKFAQINLSWMKRCLGFFIIFDLTDRESFECAWQWHKQIDRFTCLEGELLPLVFLVGNKSDLKRQVTSTEAFALADSLAVAYYEVSALNGDRVLECYESMINSCQRELQAIKEGKSRHETELAIARKTPISIVLSRQPLLTSHDFGAFLEILSEKQPFFSMHVHPVFVVLCGCNCYWALLASVSVSFISTATAVGPASDLQGDAVRQAQQPLSAHVFETKPIGTYYAFSEQRTALYLCGSMWELASGVGTGTGVAGTETETEKVMEGDVGRCESSFECYGCARGGIDLPDFAKALGEAHFRGLWDMLFVNNNESQTTAIGKPEIPECIDVEAWPVQNDFGQITWAIARWKKSKRSSTPSFSEGNFHWAFFPSSYEKTQPLFAELYRPSETYGSQCIFQGPPSEWFWFNKPFFGDCLWVDNSTLVPLPGRSSWLPLEMSNLYSVTPKLNQRACIYLPQPPRVRGESTSFLLHVCDGIVEWPKEWNWVNTKAMREAHSLQDTPHVRTISFPSTFTEELHYLTQQQAGEVPVERHPMLYLNHRQCSNLAEESKLQEVVTYLSEYYTSMGLQTWTQKVSWQGKAFKNLVAVIPGRNSNSGKYPIIIADHFDVAWREDVYSTNKTLIASLGADDDASGTAALMIIAQVLKDVSSLQRDIWLAHLVGEEFPADDLGARFLVSKLLEMRRDATAFIVLDMIGFNSDNTFQINPSDTRQSSYIAKILMAAAQQEAPNLKVISPDRWDSTSFLYNTDGITVALAGYPVVLVNEHFNAEYNFRRAGYHDNKDTTSSIDKNYHTAITRTVAVAALTLASVPAPRTHSPGRLYAPLLLTITLILLILCVITRLRKCKKGDIETQQLVTFPSTTKKKS